MNRQTVAAEAETFLAECTAAFDTKATLDADDAADANRVVHPDKPCRLGRTHDGECRR